MVGGVWDERGAVRVLGFAIFLLALSGSFAAAQQNPSALLLIDDPLTNYSTVGQRAGIPPSTFGTPGVFVAEGWKCTQKHDAIYYHLPYAVSRGWAEFEVKGLYPNELRGDMRDKTELFHMYDYTWNNADNQYAPGYRDDPYKMFIRKIGLWDAANPAPNVDKLEIVWQILPSSMEPDSNERPAWDPNTWYKFVVEWGPDGTGNTTLSIKLNGSPITTNPRMWAAGFYAPGGHSIRLGASTRSLEGTSAPIDGIYRNFKVYQLPPIPPTIVRPINGATYNTRTPVIEWVGEAHAHYQVRICTANDPESGIVWDSGAVASGASQVSAGTLPNNANYYVFVKIANQAGWSDWSSGGYWFRVDTSFVFPRMGNVQISGNCLIDGGGTFLGLGATYMRALQRCKYDRPRFKRDLSVLASMGFNYVRILTMVGWDGLEIAPLDIPKSGYTVPAWPDYWQQFRDMIDIAYDEYRLRTEITIFADAQTCMPNSADRYAHMDNILANLAGRQHKIMLIEVANEYWQNGFPDPGGVNTIRTYGAYLAARTSIPIALSSPSNSESDSAILQMYSGSAADITTIHLTRNTGTFEGGWLPVRDSWRVASLYPSIPPASSNEPIGPGSSVSTENDPIKLSSAATFAWITKFPMYVFHSRAGVSSIDSSGNSVHFEDMPGIDSYRYLHQLLPSDLPNWTRNDGKESAAPFTVYCNGQPNKYWTDFGGAASDGCHRNIGSRSGGQFVCYPQGILSGGLTLEARQEMTFTVYNPLTGAVVLGPVVKQAGQQLHLDQGPGAYIIRGVTSTDTTPPGPPTGFTAVGGEMENVLSWTNPSDEDLAGVRILCKTDAYPYGPNDGTVIFEGFAATARHTGIKGGQRYYYRAYSYDEVPNYSTMGAAATVITPGTQCYADTFNYPDGNLNGKNGWSGSAGSEIVIEGQKIKISMGTTTFQCTKPVICSGSGGIIWVEAKVKAGAGASTLWGLWIDDASGLNLARWYGSGTTARPRIGGTGIVLDPVPLTGNWDTIAVRIDTNLDTSEFFFNGSSRGTLSHSSTGAGNSVGNVRIERIGNTTTPEFVYLDNLVIGPPDITGPGPVTNFKALGGDGQVTLSWTNPTDYDFAGTRILFKTTGPPANPADGTLVYSGTGTSCLHSGLVNGTRYYYTAFAFDEVPNYSSRADAVAHAAADATIPEAKGLSDGQARAIRGCIVSLAESGFFYIQDPGLYSGLRVVSSDTVAQGQKVDVLGVMAGQGAERYLDCQGNPVVLINPGPFTLRPLGMASSSAGGASLNSYAPGVVGGIGPNNVGLLARIWGTVTQRDTSGLRYFYIDDGCGLRDGTRTPAGTGEDNIGIRIMGNPTQYPSGSYVAVNGVVSLFNADGLRAQILPQAQGIQPIAP